MKQPPISDYALLSDCRSAALVSQGGSVDWLCFPRFDGASVFGRLIDPDAGHWSIHPTTHADVSRRYLERSMVLETTFRTESGIAVLTDAMAMGRNNRGHELGLRSPGVLLRKVECTDGEVELEMEYRPRPEYGLITPLMTAGNRGVFARGGADVLMLSSPVRLALGDATAGGRFVLRSGDVAGFALAHRFSWESAPRPWTEDEIATRLKDTIAGWHTWSELHQNYEGPWQDLVRHSGRVLQALTFQPTGAIVAAPTTSLPETVGGERNWDYRYAWVRDASFTLQALWVAACPDEAIWFFRWMAGAVAAKVGEGADLQIMFGVGGEHDLSERELGHLSGYMDSQPVRVGNGAWTQRQLDVYGEVLDAAHRLAEQLTGLDETTSRFLTWCADTAAVRWNETDQGIWEVRGPPQHFLYSKLMCWVALDRAIDMAELLRAKRRVPQWSKARDAIRDAILESGWSEKQGAFTQSFGSEALDASNLMMPIVGFVSGDDPKMKATIEAISERLTDQRGLVYRYSVDHTDDGLAGDEGTFLLCTFWLAQALALAGEVERAKETCQRAVDYANDVGLLAEEVDPKTGELLGNFPQAFSHIGLINAAWAITEAEARRG